MVALTSYVDALAAAVAVGAAARLPVEEVPLADADGRTIAEEVVVPRSLPHFASSAMDGYAVRAGDVAGATDDRPTMLRVVAESQAGTPADGAVRPGTAIRISTGARVPEGADAIVRVEDTTEADGTVAVRVSVEVGRNVRPVGEDVAAGDVAARVGDRLHPGRIALLGGIGVTTVTVSVRPTVTVVATGDEVVVGGGELADGEVHDVNGLALPALLRAAGVARVEVVRAPDDRDATIQAFADATGDVVVSCGGVSAGRHDHVRPSLQALGAEQVVFGVALQPGKPTWIGTLDGRPVLGLPGNPASTLVTATLFLLPALRAMTGAPPTEPRWGRLIADAPSDPRRLRALRAVAVPQADGVLGVRPLAGQPSHHLGALADADLLALVPPRDGGPLPAGSTVEVVRPPGVGA
ncbi:MAG: molybdopterin molybdotransferase MoeA [Solirubrobacteraceae bacterium]|nr:molybdopterin molybdotransferase MoeA [Solirubrobacteraceae bacterium]